MDEFNELDKELDKLRSELSLQDEFQRHFQSPAPGDYWRKRMDEEKALWTRKAGVGEEEKKILEGQLEQQRKHIEAYNEKIAQLERKFDQETRTWEDRLRNKEAELLVEKNRLLSEQRIKETEFDNRNHLVKIGDLNAEINTIKEAGAREIKKLNEEFAKEKAGYEERIKGGQDSIAVLQARISELEQRLAESKAEFELVTKDYHEKIKSADDKINQLGSENEGLRKEKNGLHQDIETINRRNIEDKLHAEKTFRAAGAGFVLQWRKYVGALMGVVQFMSTHRVKKSAWEVVGGLLEDIDEQTELLAAEANMTGQKFGTYTAAVLAQDGEFADLHKALAGESAELHRINPKKWKYEIPEMKPRILFTSTRYYGLAKKISRRWKFIPVVVSGDMTPGFMKKAAGRGFTALHSPSTDSEISAALNAAAFRSAAYTDYWNQIKVKSPAIAPIAAALLIAAAAIAGYEYHKNPMLFAPPVKSAVFSTPYPQPTNLAFDGQNLWACDWYGQSIYKQTISGGDLGISRIFYFPNKHFSALTWMNGNLWSADAVGQKIYKHNSDDGLTITAAYDSPGPAPSGMAGDTDFIWVCDASEAKIYKLAVDGGLTVVEEAASPGKNPSALYFDGTNLWSTDSVTNKMYRHDINNGLRVTATYNAPGYEQKGYNLSGLTGSAKYFWICSEKAGRIYQFPKSMVVSKQ